MQEREGKNQTGGGGGGRPPRKRLVVGSFEFLTAFPEYSQSSRAAQKAGCKCSSCVRAETPGDGAEIERFLQPPLHLLKHQN
jgi:hypothetical protein